MAPLAQHRPTACIATVIDANMWRAAAVLVQQLINVGTALPIVVFNLTTLPTCAVTLVRSLGAQVTSLDPPMVIPPEFGSKLMGRPFLRSGRPVLSRFAPWAKLAIWGQTRWSKVVLLDVDVVLLRPIDEMADMPVDTFSPETCNSVAPQRCAATDELTKHTTAGFNAGVMVIGPSTRRFASMGEFASGHIARLLRECTNQSDAAQVERHYLAYPEQSFLKRYWPTVMRSTIEGGRPRNGYDWQWRTYHDSELGASCAASSSADAADGCGTTSFMSRLYNARPYDCSTCAAEYVARVKVVHYTCSYKPWSRPKDAWARCAGLGDADGEARCGRDVTPCAANWTMRWHAARDVVCERARTAGLGSEMDCNRGQSVPVHSL